MDIKILAIAERVACISKVVRIRNFDDFKIKIDGLIDALLKKKNNPRPPPGPGKPPNSV